MFFGDKFIVEESLRRVKLAYIEFFRGFRIIRIVTLLRTRILMSKLDILS